MRRFFFWPKMSILGLDQVLQLANQYQALADGGDGGDGGDGDRRGRGRGQLRCGRGRGQLRRGRGRGRLGRGLMQANHNRQGEARRAGALSSMKQRQLVRQSLHFNKTGHARTLDHQLPGQDFKRRKPTGKGNGRPGHRRPSSGLVLEMRRQLADSWQMRWREHLRRSCPGLAICSPHL